MKTKKIEKFINMKRPNKKFSNNFYTDEKMFILKIVLIKEGSSKS